LLCEPMCSQPQGHASRTWRPGWTRQYLGLAPTVDSRAQSERPRPRGVAHEQGGQPPGSAQLAPAVRNDHCRDLPAIGGGATHRDQTDGAHGRCNSSARALWGALSSLPGPTTLTPGTVMPGKRSAQRKLPTQPSATHIWLIHGTWARNARWAEASSTFCEGLRHNSAIPVETHEFAWTGRNRTL